MLFSGFFSNKNEKNEKKMNKPVYIGLSILVISKTLMYELWYDYIKPKYQTNGKLCYMDTVLLFTLKEKIFMKILLMMFKKD